MKTENLAKIDLVEIKWVIKSSAGGVIGKKGG